MQVFLPYPDFKKSLESLDNKRLGKGFVGVKFREDIESYVD